MGTRLLQAVKEEAVQRGCSRLSLLNMRDRESYQREFLRQRRLAGTDDAANFIFDVQVEGGAARLRAGPLTAADALWRTSQNSLPIRHHLDRRSCLDAGRGRFCSQVAAATSGGYVVSSGQSTSCGCSASR